jgi:sugar/nucleoside kinase (ribokinase family)
MAANYDVYAYGVIASSTLHLLAQPFPQADGYAELAETFSMTGGEALNSAIVMRRLGLSVRLDGNWLGDTRDGQFLLDTMMELGIDAQRLVVEPNGVGAREVVVSDEDSRTIFGNYIALLTSGRRWNVPRQADVAAARIVCVDPPFGDESAAVGRMAESAGVPFVAIDCPFDSQLATASAAVIVSGEYRKRAYASFDVESLFDDYCSRSSGLVVLTQGEGSVLFGRAGGPAARLPAFDVQTRDTAGAGDAFRAGLIYGLLQGWHDRDAVRYAAAVAAIVCTRFPGVMDSPTHAEVEGLLETPDQA